MNAKTLLIACALCVASVGCAGAQVVGKGELSMWGPVMPAAQEGREALLTHCGGAYRVDERGEALGLGRRTATLPPAPGTASVAGADAAELRTVRFRCEDASHLASR